MRKFAAGLLAHHDPRDRGGVGELVVGHVVDDRFVVEVGPPLLHVGLLHRLAGGGEGERVLVRDVELGVVARRHPRHVPEDGEAGDRLVLVDDS